MYYKVPPELGVDVDGCLVNNFIVWKEYFNQRSEQHNHKKIITENDSPHWDFFQSICEECWDFVLHNPEMIATYKVVPLAKEILTFFRDLGANLHIITQIPSNVVDARRFWIKENFGDLFKSVNFVNNKLECCKELGIKYHLDDAPHHVRAFQTQDEIIPIIYDHPYNSFLEGIRIHNWIEYASMILNLTSKEKIKNG